MDKENDNRECEYQKSNENKRNGDEMKMNGKENC